MKHRRCIWVWSAALAACSSTSKAPVHVEPPPRRAEVYDSSSQPPASASSPRIDGTPHDKAGPWADAEAGGKPGQRPSAAEMADPLPTEPPVGAGKATNNSLAPPPTSPTLPSIKRAGGVVGGGAHGEHDDAKRALKAEEGAPARTAAPAPPVLKAGRHDDNKEYSRFLAFLQVNVDKVARPVDVSERLVVRLLDHNGKSLSNCQVQVRDLRGTLLSTSITYADGQTQFFPAAMSTSTDRDYMVQARCGDEQHHVQLQRSGRRQVDVRFDMARQVPARVPLDVAIVLDTTGSMQSQIDRLKQTLEAIHFQLTQLPSQPDVHFGLVAYRDRGDTYVTRVTPFTGNVQAFAQVLNQLQADGGGDTPEDMQAGLEQAMHTLRWRADAVRVGFVVGDAPPHTDYDQPYDYRAAMEEALQRGIKWVGVGVGGLGVDAEVILRQIAEFTLGEYVFVTDTEGGDTMGTATEASHHVGTNYHAENLDQAIVRIVRRELSYLGDDPRDFDDTIRASAEPGDPARREVLTVAVSNAVRQLSDYSALPLGQQSPVAVLPVAAADKQHKEVACRLTDELILAASRHPNFRVVERDLHAIAQELKVQLSALSDDTQAVPIGKLIGAQLLVTSKVTVHGDKAELFARLVRVETGEILSVAKVDLQTALLDKQ